MSKPLHAALALVTLLTAAACGRASDPAASTPTSVKYKFTFESSDTDQHLASDGEGLILRSGGAASLAAEWVGQSEDGDYWTFKNRSSGKCLRLSGEFNLREGLCANATLFDTENTDVMPFRKARAVGSNRCIGRYIAGGSSAVGQSCDSSASHWIIQSKPL